MAKNIINLNFVFILFINLKIIFCYEYKIDFSKEGSFLLLLKILFLFLYTIY